MDNVESNRNGPPKRFLDSTLFDALIANLYKRQKKKNNATAI